MALHASVAVAYVAFLILLWLWLRTKADDYDGVDELIDLLPKGDRPRSGLAWEGAEDDSAAALRDGTMMLLCSIPLNRSRLARARVCLSGSIRAPVQRMEQTSSRFPCSFSFRDDHQPLRTPPVHFSCRQ